MKVRNDYVSNSSSSSYIIAMHLNQSLNCLISDIVKSCTDQKDYDYDEGYIQRLNEENRRNMDYCWNTYQLLFLGDLVIGSHKNEFIGADEYNVWKKRISNVMSGYRDPENCLFTVTEDNGADRLVLNYPDYAHEVVVSNNVMDSLHCWGFTNKDDEACVKKERDARIKRILDISKRSSDYQVGTDYIHLYEITMRTVINTEELIAAGHKIILPEWCSGSKLDDIKKRLEDGQRLFSLEMAQGGDGSSSGKIYATNGWDSDFNKYANVEILDCECG